MNKGSQKELLNKHIDKTSSIQAEKQFVKYYINLEGTEIIFKLAKN